VNARVQLEEFLTAYLAEVDEQLSIANARLLLIEAGLRKSETNPRAVRDLFRALHTIKGLSSMVGVEPVVAIAHRMETLLRAADRAEGALPAPALEPLIAGLRAIELRVRALAAKKPVPPPPSALLASLDALEAGESPGGTAPALDLEPAISGKLAAFEKQQLVRAIEEGRRAVRLEFVPSAERAAAGQSINSVRERLAPIAEIVKVVPIAIQASLAAPGGLAFVILLVTSADDGALASASGIDPSSIRTLGVAVPRGNARAMLAPIATDEDPELPEEPDRRNLLRVDVSRVDDAMEKLASLIVSRSRLARAVGALSDLSADTRELKQISGDIARQLRDLRSSILNVRMVRVGEILERIPLIVRGLRRATGKQVRLEMDTGEAELDKAVGERIFPAILHLVRNAVDHGIESPEERRAAGKSEEGLVRITTSSRSNTQLELVVSDDGRGVDGARVAARALAETPGSDAALLDLLCRPGFSTREEVTTTSGRGMGMDIVRRVVVDQLGGELLLSTEVGVGTTFSLLVPLTIAIVDAFTTQCGEERFVVPVSMVEEILEVDPEQIVSAPVTLPGGATQLGMFERRGEAVPIVDLASLLRIRRDEGSRARKALVVRKGGQPVAFVLDRVLGQQEVVVRPLADPLVNVPGVTGATDLGDGRPTLVLDLVALAGTRTTRILRPAPSAPALPSAARLAGRP
jgi:two-component system, chemotaxis family, sensor kinase CheA